MNNPSNVLILLLRSSTTTSTFFKVLIIVFWPTTLSKPSAFLASSAKSTKEYLIFRGKDIEGVTTIHPFYNRESVVILGEHVTEDAGTGCVHTAPGHGADDFNVGAKYHLPPYCPVDEHGMMDETCGERLQGLFYEKANENHCPRLICKKSIIISLTDNKFSFKHHEKWVVGKIS